MRSMLNTSGIFHYAWIIPYSIGLIIFMLGYARFIMWLPARIRVLFILSGALYVGGAIGIELISGRHSSLYGPNNLTYALYYTCEELLEMLGIASFIYTLRAYVTEQFQPLTIEFNE